MGGKKKPRGRPSVVTPEAQKEILERLTKGESARSICRDPRMPDWGRVCEFKHKPKNADFQAQYARAKQAGIEANLDELDERVRDESRDYTEVIVERTDKEGNVKKTVEKKSDNTAVMRDRLIADTLKWSASKLFPKQYGDKLTQEHVGEDGGPIRYESVVDRPPKESREEWESRVRRQLEERAKALPN